MNRQLGRWTLLLVVGLAVAMPAYAGRGGSAGGGQMGEGMHAGPASNRQLEETSTRSLERAEQRRAEQAKEHARSGQQAPASEKQKALQREQDRKGMPQAHEPNDQMKEKAKAKKAPEAETGERSKDRAQDRDQDRDRLSDKGAADQAPRGESADKQPAKKRWWWPFGE